MIELQIFGNASNKIYKVIKVLQLNEVSLMDFLRNNEVPVASSCYGEGVCRKCVINKNILSCQMSLNEFIGNTESQEDTNIQIEIDYL
jgi:Na+-transporting NADH:ubiquinone oxidoreductase subunit NqrF